MNNLRMVFMNHSRLQDKEMSSLRNSNLWLQPVFLFKNNIFKNLRKLVSMLSCCCCYCVTAYVIRPIKGMVFILLFFEESRKRWNAFQMC